MTVEGISDTFRVRTALAASSFVDSEAGPHLLLNLRTPFVQVGLQFGDRAAELLFSQRWISMSVVSL